MINIINLLSIKFILIIIAAIFTFGLIGVVLNRHNVIILLLYFEIMYLCASLIFIFFSFFSGNILGIFYFIFSLAIVGAEACVSLSILSHYFNTTKEINLTELDLTKY